MEAIDIINILLAVTFLAFLIKAVFMQRRERVIGDDEQRRGEDLKRVMLGRRKNPFSLEQMFSERALLGYILITLAAISGDLHHRR